MPGFQQIGLLPSERSSLSPQRNTEIEGLDGKNAGGSPVAVAVQDKNTGDLTENAVSKSPTVVDFPPKMLNNGSSGKDCHGTRLTSISDKLVVAPALNQRKRHNESPNSERLNPPKLLEMKDLLERCRMSIQTTHDRFNSLKLINPVADYDDETSSLESAVHNTVESDFLPSISPEFIRKQIAEALLEYDGARHGTDDQPSTVARLTFNIDLGGVSTVKATKLHVKSDRSNNALFSVNSTIGPFTITYPHIARGLQLSLVTFYTILLLGSALLGPKTFTLTVWRMTICLGVYAIAVFRLGWAEHLERDVFLAPVFFALSVAQGVGEQMIEQVRAEIAAAVADGVAGVVGGE